jgi:hypothetical protein
MPQKKIKQAFLFLCDKSNDSNIEAFNAIQSATRELGDAFILYHQKNEAVPPPIMQQQHVSFTNHVLTQHNYIPIGFNLIPGNNHYPLLSFYQDNPDYTYYWNIEEDVRFSGDWRYFFDAFADVGSDFLSSHIRTSLEEPEWIWWPALMNPYEVIPFEKRLRSFNPIYRMSGKGMEFICQALSSHWCGHHEVLFPTLLNLNGYNIMDFGGEGQFVMPGFENRFYINNTPNSKGELKDGTVRFRPRYKEPGDEKDKLYHPVKN